MKNMVVVNYHRTSRTSEQGLRRLVEAQIANSLELGWSANDIVVVSNLAFDGPGVVIQAPLNEICLTGSKVFAIDYLFQIGAIESGEVWWVHDLDAWQNYWFEPPAFNDIGLAEYNIVKFNGGSVFLRASARDMIGAVKRKIMEDRANREEPAINAVLRSREYRDRVTVINSTFNVGCSAYSVRHARSEKPILVSHFHPEGVSGWRTHTQGDRHLKEGSLSPRLRALLVHFFHNGAAPLLGGL